ncbi:MULTISPECIES: response regulator [Aeromonas]|uniref:response regulator n=1 Tax=Aeromonas TaxID=642 RepID=UPI0012F26F67|nr:response regulator [Aeromonas salmonicida]MBS2780911.1 response regulator [Aeromonas salmonicida]MDR6993670.1 chemotaxis protein CheY-P-specific phosphatase CheC/ActR/RegA family two-component response regulator [Aeromonas salmonicida]WCH29041.1 response regulator [Aeromonas salmonicida]VXA79565.1 Response regulator/CheC domain protein [Aeromonas salmonicida]HEH9397798.1 response regulator [Aeromonas salmonicida]
MNVLICDDSGFARKQLARALPADWDVTLHYAANGLEGIEQVLMGHGDLIFLDLTMPEMDGYGVLETLQQEGLRNKVFVVSGDIQPEAHQRVMSLGALDFIKKPAAPETLTALLRQHGLWQPNGVASTPAPLLAGIATAEPDADVGIKISPEIRDVYQELANVSMGQAADLLARLLNAFVVLPIPNVNVLEVSELHMALSAAADSDTLSAVCQGFIGAGIAGEALILFHDSSFKDLARLMNHQGALDRNAELELLMDTANVLIGAFLRGYASQLDTPFSQGHPVVLGQHRPIKDLINTNKSLWRRTLAIEINYRVQDYAVQCDLLLLFTEDSIATMNNKIMHML